MIYRTCSLLKRLDIFDCQMVSRAGIHRLEVRDTVNSGQLRIPYPVPVCVMGNLWLVKFNDFILQLISQKQTINFLHAQTGTEYRIRS